METEVMPVVAASGLPTKSDHINRNNRASTFRCLSILYFRCLVLLVMTVTIIRFTTIKKLSTLLYRQSKLLLYAVYLTIHISTRITRPSLCEYRYVSKECSLLFVLILAEGLIHCPKCVQPERQEAYERVAFTICTH